VELRLPQPGVWLAIGLAALVIAVQSALSVPVAMIDMAVREALHRTSGLLHNPLVLGLMNTLAFGVVIAFGLYLNRLPLRRAYPLPPATAGQVGALCLLVVGSVVVLSEIDNLVRAVLPMPDILRDLLDQIFSADSSILAQAFLLVVVAPVTEELLFRGIILRGLLNHCRVWSALVLSATLFAFIHLNPWQMMTAFAVGLTLGWVFLRTGSVWLCVLGHALNNGLFLCAQHSPFEVPGLIGVPDPDKVVFQPLWLDLLGISLVLVALWLFRCATPRPPPVKLDVPPVIEPPIISAP